MPQMEIFAGRMGETVGEREVKIVYVRGDQPFGGAAAPAAVYFYSPDRGGEHPERHLAGYAGILQADAYAGFNTVYKPERKPGLFLNVEAVGASTTPHDGSPTPQRQPIPNVFRY
jgi:hypothetical protein